MSFNQLQNIWDDFLVSLILLTKIPVSRFRKNQTTPNLTKAQWAFPLVGALVGFIVILIANALNSMGLNAAASSSIGIVAGLFVVGAFHENGLANMLDIFTGEFDKEQNVKIMKKSRLATYGTLGLIFYTFLKISLISNLLGAPGCILLVVGAHALGRTSMVIIRKFSMAANDKSSNLLFSKASPSQIILSILLGAMWFIPISFSLVIISTCFILIVTLGLRFLASNRIGGISNDVLGASVLIGEISLLTLFNLLFAVES
jgi:adenosylcobinamide-GDP ribazoletransferase